MDSWEEALEGYGFDSNTVVRILSMAYAKGVFRQPNTLHQRVADFHALGKRWPMLDWRRAVHNNTDLLCSLPRNLDAKLHALRQLESDWPGFNALNAAIADRSCLLTRAWVLEALQARMRTISAVDRKPGRFASRKPFLLLSEIPRVLSKF